MLAAVGGALTAAYFLRLLRRVTHGPAAAATLPAPPVARRRSGRPGRRWSLLALLIGLVPALVLGATADPSPP